MDTTASRRQQIIDTIQVLPNDTLAELQAFVQQLSDRTTEQPTITVPSVRYRAVRSGYLNN
ncbi:MAG: hypothetical protein ACAF41_23580 [Leptolyngbya sp. BL-A-14]